MIKRRGDCKRCGRCCRSFNLLAGAMSDFKRAEERHGLKLLINPDGKTYKCNMLTENNLCGIHEDKPKPCRDAPRMHFPWDCGYKFVYVDTKEKDVKETEKALSFFESLPKIKEMDAHTKEILQGGRKSASKSRHNNR